jgi:hypothetical protein
MNFSPREFKLELLLRDSRRQDVLSKRLAELREQLPPPQSIAEAPTELLEYILCHQLMLTEADRALRAASIALTGDTTDVSITELPEEIVAVSTKRIKNSTKHSSATKASNKKRGVSLSRQAVASLYAAFLEICRREGKMPGWKRVSDRGQQILKRAPDLKRKREAQCLTKARTQKWIRVFQSLEPEMLNVHTPEDILKLYDLPVKRE